MNIDIKILAARVKHADAILAKLSSPENNDLYQNLLSQCGIQKELSHSLPLYTVEVALTHLMPTIFFLKMEELDDELKNKVSIIRNALAHAGELIDGEKPNIELTKNNGITFRTRNGGGKEISFNTRTDFADFIANINNEFSKHI